MASSGTPGSRNGLKTGPRARRGVLGTLLYWAPVWLPGLLIGQIVFNGLKPTLAEETRLDRVEAQLIERERKIAEAEALQLKNKRMLEDEIYRERVRKSVGIPGEEPLKLEHDLKEDE